MKKYIQKTVVWIMLFTLITSSYMPSFVVMAEELTDSQVTVEEEKAEETVAEEQIEKDDSTLEESTSTTTLEPTVPNDTVAESEVSTPTVSYQAHVQNVGWQSMVSDGAVAGTIGRNLRMESLKVQIGNTDLSGDVVYQTHVQNIGWQDNVSNGTIAGTIGRSLRLEAIRIQLTGELAEKYDIYYRVHVEKFGWLDWASNGDAAGTAGYSYRMEAIEIKLVEKGGSAPGSTTNAYIEHDPVLTYRTHVQNIGWQGFVQDGGIAGTIGKSLRMEALQISLKNTLGRGGIEYQTHIQNIGWQDWVSNGQIAGTTGKKLRLEALRIRLTGDLADQYDIYYRVHVEKFGWLDWTSNGKIAGTEGFGFRMEAIQIKLVKKGNPAPGATGVSYYRAEPFPSYTTYVRGRGWLPDSKDGGTSGTTNQSRQLESILIALNNKFDYTGTIEYQAHVQEAGWQDWVSAGTKAGVIGKRLEAIRIRLTEDLAEEYDIYYRAHVENYGWLDWASNGEIAGSTSIGFRMEAIQIKMVKKGSPTPGDTTKPYVTGGFKEEGGYTYYYRDGVMSRDWEMIDGKKYFFNSLGHLIASDAKFIIDVSEHQGTINWDQVKAEGKVDGVIVRVGFASMTEDKQLANNIANLKRLGIPYGIYLFSYAENKNEADLEANFVLSLIKKYNLNPTLGIYYDIENWAISGVENKISIATYDEIIPTFINKLKQNGYQSGVYTGLNYSLERLSESMRQYITWIAQYNHYCQYPGSYKMWQYGGEAVSGITGNVDSNVMSDYFER